MKQRVTPQPLLRSTYVYLLLDTSTSTCRVWLIDGADEHYYEWVSERELARGLLQFLVECTERHKLTLVELRGLGVYRGPGSFTGLRIGVSSLNTLASFADIPIVGAVGDGWRNESLERLRSGVNDKIVLPEYGREARITTPRK